MLLGKNTKYGNEMAVSELQKIVSEIEKESGFSIYDIFIMFSKGYTMKAPEWLIIGGEDE
nr:MAG TPA: hypothetical protein [Caudoviricetes sp.]